MRTCTYCHEAKDASAYYKHAKAPDGLQSRCKACFSGPVARDGNRRLRARAHEGLGGKCAHCGNDDHRVLQIDHIVPLNQSKGRDWAKTARAAAKGDPNFQLLCANCHAIKTWHS